MQNKDSSELASGLRRTELAPNSRHSLNLPAGITPYYLDEQAGIAIYNCDCREILPLLPDKSVDLVLTDPPYGIRIVWKSNKYGVRVDLSRVATNETWDDSFPDETVWQGVFRISVNQIVFGANYGWQHFHSSGCYIIWDKRGNLPSVPFAPTEFAWASFEKQSKKYTVLNHGFITDMVEARGQHPCQKPESLMRQIIGRLYCQWLHHPRSLHGQRDDAGCGEAAWPEGHRYRDRRALR